MKYESFKKNGYIFPPRPEYKCSPEDLDKYDNGEYIAMPKYDGSACVTFTNGKELQLYNRHKEELNLLSDYKEIDFMGLAKTSNWFVYAGEYLNKSKLGETGINENNRFVIWDVLVWDGRYLVGSTLMERLHLLENIYPCQRSVVKDTGIEIYDHLCCTELKNIYKAPAYLNNFKELYYNIINTQLYEGLVLKKRNSKLSFGLQEQNNTDWQIKARRETKNYQF